MSVSGLPSVLLPSLFRLADGRLGTPTSTSPEALKAEAKKLKEVKMANHLHNLFGTLPQQMFFKGIEFKDALCAPMLHTWSRPIVASRQACPRADH